MRNWSSWVGAPLQFVSLLQTQYWDNARLQEYQQRKLRQILKAASSIPFYREHFDARPAVWDFRKLPVLKRSHIGELNRSVRSLFPAGFKFLCDRSSGSTGMPAEFIFDCSHQSNRFAARARYLLANGWNPLLRLDYLPA